MKYYKIFNLVTISIMLCILLPSWVQDGMFLDGVTYSSISKNMAEGIGTYWNPHYTDTLYPNFHEHPPLVFIIQSLFFKLLGDHFFTERIYCVFTTILTVLGIYKCWNLFCPKTDLNKYNWIPVLLWICSPLISWSYKNNLLENTLSFLTLFSIYYISKSLIKQNIWYLFLGGIFIVLAVISKGAVGFFPIISPILYAISIGANQKTLFYSFLLIVFTFLFGVSILYFIPELKINLSLYAHEQLVPALNNKREITTGNRFAILLQLIQELAIPLVLLIIFIILKKLKIVQVNFFKNKASLYFLLIAVSASLPIIVTLKQRSFYLVPSLPFYALALGLEVLNPIKQLISRINWNWLKWIKQLSYCLIVIIITISIIYFGKFQRDKEQLEDVYKISNYIPKGSLITATNDVNSDWGLIAYMSRIGNYSLDCQNKHKYFLCLQNFDITKFDSADHYSKVKIRLNKYDLYETSKFINK